MNPLANGHDDSLSLLREIRDALRQIDRRLDQLASALQQRSVIPPVRIGPLHEMTDGDLQKRLAEARSAPDAYAVLEIRRILMDRLEPGVRMTLDRELAEWFTDYFQNALRNGQAATVAGAIEQAVLEIGEIPEMTHLAESLPMVLRSVGLMPKDVGNQAFEED